MEQLELILSWFQSLQIVVNEDKLKRQLSIISSWFNNKCIGAISAVTGFGKTYLAIIAIHRLNLRYPDATINVIVPSEKLLKDWLGHVKRFDLQNVSVYIVNSYVLDYVRTQIPYECTLLVCDEVHRYLSTKGKLFNKTIGCTKYNMFMGLSATLYDEEIETLHKMGIPIVDTVTMSEARRFGWVADFIVYNLGITLKQELRDIYNKYNDIFNASKAKFEWFVDDALNDQLIIACMTSDKNESLISIGNERKTGAQWRLWYAQQHRWDGEDSHDWSPKNLAKYAHQFHWAMTERKKFIYSSADKVKVARDIVARFNVPIITFAETIDFANELATNINLTVFPNTALAYHSKIKAEKQYVKETVIKTVKSVRKFREKVAGEAVYDPNIGKYRVTYNKEIRVSQKDYKAKVIKDFEEGKFKVLCTAKALDEGLNVEGIEIAIICSGTSKKRASIQRMGRAIRFIEGKRAIIVNLYLKDTQEERWVKTRQKGEANIVFIDKVEEIQQ